MNRRDFLRRTACGAAAVIAPAQAFPTEDSGRIRPWRENPYYWEYKGQPVLLLGGSDEDNLFNFPQMMRRNVAALQKCGGNYIRSTLSSRDEGNVWPFRKTNGRYDLSQWEPEYWKRLDDSLRESLNRDIIVQIEFWATFDFYRENWLVNPYNPVMNVNYTAENTRLVPEWDHHPASRVQPFFFSVPENNNDTQVLNYQRAFVNKVLDVSHKYPNVLYCLDNETKAPEEWAVYWGTMIREESTRRGVPVQLTEMWDPWDLRDEHHRRTYSHPELFSFTEVSQNNWQEGQTHYDRLIKFRETLARERGGVRPMNNVKVYHRLSKGRPNDPAVGIERWWRNIFAGCASTRFHRPPGGIGLDEQAQKTIRAARAFTSTFDIFRTAPAPELLSGHEDNEAYCLAVAGRTWALYFPQGGGVRLRTGDGEAPGVLWLDVETAAFREVTRVKPAAGHIRLESPDRNRTWLALVRR